MYHNAEYKGRFLRPPLLHKKANVQALFSAVIKYCEIGMRSDTKEVKAQHKNDAKRSNFEIVPPTFAVAVITNKERPFYPVFFPISMAA